MYRTSDPRFRRRLNEIGQTLESANESAQSSLYIFGQRYVRPCLDTVANSFQHCSEQCACCFPSAAQRRRPRAGRGRAELSFDFYDDWDEEEDDGLLGWGNEDAGPAGTGYGTITAAQPAKQGRGMSYSKKGRKKSVIGWEGEGGAAGRTSGTAAFFAGLFGGSRALKYKPSAAGLQEHPGARRLGRDITEGEALLAEEAPRGHRRARSGTVQSGGTESSYSSRGDIFPSDEEDDAIPLDDEFAMVLERRGTGGAETESSSNKTNHKRPSLASRHTSRSERSGKRKSSRTSSLNADAAPVEPEEHETITRIPTMTELKQEERAIEAEEEADVQRKRAAAQRRASERGLAPESPAAEPSPSSDDKEAPQNPSEPPEEESNAPPTPPAETPAPASEDGWIEPPADDSSDFDPPKT